MRRTRFFFALVAAAVLAHSVNQPTASAQLLKKLEQRLGGVVDKLNQPADPQAGNPTPAAAPGYLGLTADETDGQQGIVVLGVKPGSPAEAAKLQKSDLVTAINGQAVKNLDDFQIILDQVAAGQKAQFTVLRGQDAMTLTATLVARQTPPVNRPNFEDPGPPPGEPTPAFNPNAAAPDVNSSRASLGVSVVQLTEQARATYGLGASRGALIATVKAGGPADRAGLPVGGLIVAVDGQRIDTPDQVVEIVAASRPGQELELSYYRGGTLTRKTVRLAPTVLDARATPAASPTNPAIGGLLGGVGGDRPIVRRVGEVIDNLARPAGGQPIGLGEEVNALKSQVELLQATVRSLEDRLNRLEGKAAPIENEAAPQLQPGDDPVKRLELKLTPPDKPALPTPPALP